MYRGINTRVEQVVAALKEKGINVTIEDHPSWEVMVFENGLRLRASGNRYDGGFFCVDKEGVL